ncbi:Lrp/AsnC family transcriptional regulator [Chitinophaga ginsengisoli]|uniref:AsnC family transcriptional regulator n=1 Tax=Chitinophaga ginsengisoli TaxID=363837 RepID=A0A2P8GN41_9BACT|nr:Lrp/AsnC family transcriptional regulator [Chitinophaga ginsengisoli]PSL35383.1 AsnC family transcriptional regulator [Chitinophaga ginsengisoli]
MQVLDDYDKMILRQLQHNNKITADELANIVNLSASAVQRRLKRLRDEKIIEADVAIISPAVAGISITCIVEVILQEGNSKAIDAFKTAMRQCTEVMQCYYVTGAYDFVLIVNTTDMKHYEEFSKKWLMDNSNVKHFYTHVVMDKVKVGYSVAI